MIACNNVLHLVEVKPTHKKKELGPKFGAKSGLKLDFLSFTQV